jgi:hypothetical protein
MRAYPFPYGAQFGEELDMRHAVVGIVLGLALTACSATQPVAIRSGETCYGCDRTITDTSFGAQLVRPSGETSTFRTPGCLARHLRDHPESVKAIYVTDYASGKLIPVSGALFVPARGEDSMGERGFYAFRSLAAATSRAEEEFSSVIDWAKVRALAAPKKKPGATSGD